MAGQDGVRAGPAMKIGEADYRTIFGAINDAIVVFDPKTGDFLEVNQKYLEMTGFDKAEAAMLNLADVCSAEPPFSIHEAQVLMKKALEEGPQLFEWWAEDRNGRRFWVEINLTLTPLGGQDRMLVVIRDITERKRAQEALRESEERFRAFMDNSPAIAWAKDEAGRYVYLSKTLEKRLGVRLADWRGKTDFELWPQEIAQDYRENDLAVLKDGQTIDVIEQNRYPDGQPCYWWNFKFPFSDAAGRRYVGGIGVDITERQQAQEALRRAHEELEERVEERTAELQLTVGKLHQEVTEHQRAEEALQAERQRLFRLLDGLPALVQLRSPDYFLVYANKYYRQQFGDPVELPCYEILHGRQQPCEVCPSQKVFETGIPQEWEWTFSSGRTYQLYAYPFADVDGSPLVLGMGLDITDRKRAEEALRTSKEALRKSKERYRNLAGHLLAAQEAERKRLARELHDDLSQRLAALAMEAETLGHQVSLLSEADNARLKEMKDKLVGLSTDVHAMSRRLHPSILDDLGLADAVASEFAVFQERNGIAVNYQVENIGREIPPKVAVCLYRIVQEALRNISRHAGATEVAISLVGENQAIRLSIRDNGIGFDPGLQIRQVGLGLESMKERAHLIGGDLSLTSQPGQGTVIEVLAPLSRKG